MPKDEMIACEENPVVIRCKGQIAYRANMAMFQFRPDDIVCTREPDDTIVIFLRRFFTDYIRDEVGELILDENLEPIPDFQLTIWLEYREQHKIPLEVMLPRVIVRYPWLFFIIKDDQVVDGCTRGSYGFSGDFEGLPMINVGYIDVGSHNAPLN